MDLRDEAIHVASAPKDLARARELLCEYADGLKVDLCFQDFERELSELPGGYAPPDGRLLLAWHHEQPVGCIALRRVDATTGEVKRLYVRPEARGRHTGRRLVEQAIAAAKAIGYHRWCSTHCRRWRRPSPCTARLASARSRRITPTRCPG